MSAEPMKPADFVSCPPLPLNCAVITLAGERNRDHVVLPLRLELYDSLPHPFFLSHGRAYVAYVACRATFLAPRLSEKTADDLQVLNDSLFPIKYNRRFVPPFAP